MSVRTTATIRRPWPDIGRGFGALVGVLALAVAVPVALISWVGWPLPAGVPTLEEITDALRDTYIPDAFLIKALGLVCWLIWIELMASLIVEAVAYFRGREAGQVPMAGGVQRAAARLVATSALLGALVATRGMPELASRALKPPSAVALVVDEDANAVPPPGDTDRPPKTPPPPPMYEVVRRDTLWGIAECHLGDPFRWPEIYELNKGLPQPGGRALQDPDLIYPGWRLQLPGDAIGLEPPASPQSPPAPPPSPPADPPPPPSESDPGTPLPTASPTSMVPGAGMVLLDEVGRDGQTTPTSHSDLAGEP